MLGNAERGTCFDVLVLKEDNGYAMHFSRRPKSALAVCRSADGVHWSHPEIYMESDPDCGWMDNLNRHCILRHDGKWRMWFTGQARGYSWIGYATSKDGVHWDNLPANPIFTGSKEHPDDQDRVGACQIVKADGWHYMFYIGYEDIDTARICVARSRNGISGWERHPANPIVSPAIDG